MPEGTTKLIGEWSSSLRYEDIPERVHARTKAQILSVLGASYSGRHSEPAMSALDVAKSWGSGEESVTFLGGDRLPHLNAIFANACASVSFDFDDYLFAGHTGHSAVCAALAYGQLEGASGRDVLAAIAVGNEVGGRLGASLLFGPHNGQMWSYIHVLEGACVASRFLGQDAGRTTNAIGIAFTQPPHPLMPAFMGPDSKLLIPASTTVDGCRAAELAARGWTGAQTILEDHQGFLRRFNENNLGWILSGFGDAWLSDSLTYKIVPGCAYVDTAVDSLTEIMRTFEAENGRPMTAADVESISVKCGMFTSGMEGFSHMYRSAERLEPITINFSVALSFGLMLTAGALEPQYLAHKYLDEHRDEIEAAGAKVAIAHDPEIDRRSSAAAEGDGFALASVLSGKSLDGVSFQNYVMAFPADVTVKTTLGVEMTASQDVPLGGAGRPWDETSALVVAKFRKNHPGPTDRTDSIVSLVERLEELNDVTTLADLLSTQN